MQARNSVILSKLKTSEQLNVYSAKGHGFVVIAKDEDMATYDLNEDLPNIAQALTASILAQSLPSKRTTSISEL